MFKKLGFLQKKEEKKLFFEQKRQKNLILDEFCWNLNFSKFIIKVHV